MTTTPLTLDPIKTKHRAMWALGNYDNVATEVLIGQPPPCSSEMERPSAARPSKIPEERIEKPTPAGRAPSVLAASTARVRPAPPGGARRQKRQQDVASANAAL